MVKDDDKPVVHYMLLNSVLGTEQRSSYVTAQLLTQCVNPTFKRHLLLCIVGLIPVAVGLSSTERLPSSLRSASLPPLCGAPNPAGKRKCCAIMSLLDITQLERVAHDLRTAVFMLQQGE